MASSLQAIGEVDLADEIGSAVNRAARYASM
jgi:hypothetical protein